MVLRVNTSYAIDCNAIIYSLYKNAFVFNFHSQSHRSDCYEAKLRIARTDSADSRHYYLNIENNKGNDKYSVILQVRGEFQTHRHRTTIFPI